MNIIDILFPKRCAFCGKRNETEICGKCVKDLPWVSDQNTDCIAPLYYRGVARKAMHRFKFHGELLYAGVFGRLMAQCTRENMPEINSMTVTWVPSSRKRVRKRGFDQCEELAKVISAELKLPLMRSMRKVKHNIPQSRLSSLKERKDNVGGAFETVCDLKGGNVLLIDDIRTTGATLDECAEILRKAGAKDVHALVGAKK